MTDFTKTGNALASSLSAIKDQVIDSRPLNAGVYRGFLVRLDASGLWQAWKDESGPTFTADTRSDLEFMIDEDELDDEETFGNPLPISEPESQTYRDFTIYLGWMTPEGQWHFEHKDYDGAPINPGEGPADHRCGVGKTAADCRDQIDEMILDLEDEEAAAEQQQRHETEQDIDDGRFDDCRYDGSPDALYDDALNGEDE